VAQTRLFYFLLRLLGFFCRAYERPRAPGAIRRHAALALACALLRALGFFSAPGAAAASDAGDVYGAADPAGLLLLDCETLMRALRTFMGIRTEMEVAYAADTCLSSSMMRMFLRETSALVVADPAPPHGVLVALRNNDPGLAQILVLAMVGRHYTAQFRTGQVFFEFDLATQILTPHMPRCEYQRSFFVLLLFVSIVLMVFSLVMQNLNNIERKREEASTAPSAPSAASISVTTATSRGILSHISIGIAQQRCPIEGAYARLLA